MLTWVRRVNEWEVWRRSIKSRSRAEYSKCNSHWPQFIGFYFLLWWWRSYDDDGEVETEMIIIIYDLRGRSQRGGDEVKSLFKISQLKISLNVIVLLVKARNPHCWEMLWERLCRCHVGGMHTHTHTSWETGKTHEETSSISRRDIASVLNFQRQHSMLCSTWSLSLTPCRLYWH